MTKTIKAHFDGRVIVPDEPVSLPLHQPLKVELEIEETEQVEAVKAGRIAERRRRLRQATGHIKGVTIPLEALDRENFYEERV
ncbi:MAG: hypothetical protein M3347_07150 [Armatimonadota bacterium]|nr:hypothetical protein [Armatimonadota bacterium]